MSRFFCKSACHTLLILQDDEAHGVADIVAAVPAPLLLSAHVRHQLCVGGEGHAVNQGVGLAPRTRAFIRRTVSSFITNVTFFSFTSTGLSFVMTVW